MQNLDLVIVAVRVSEDSVPTLGHKAVTLSQIYIRKKKNLHLCICDRLRFIVPIITELLLDTYCEPGTVLVSLNAFLNLKPTECLCGEQYYHSHSACKDMKPQIVQLAQDH